MTAYTAFVRVGGLEECLGYRANSSARVYLPSVVHKSWLVAHRANNTGLVFVQLCVSYRVFFTDDHHCHLIFWWIDCQCGVYAAIPTSSLQYIVKINQPCAETFVPVRMSSKFFYTLYLCDTTSHSYSARKINDHGVKFRLERGVRRWFLFSKLWRGSPFKLPQGSQDSSDHRQSNTYTRALN